MICRLLFNGVVYCSMLKPFNFLVIFGWGILIDRIILSIAVASLSGAVNRLRDEDVIARIFVL